MCPLELRAGAAALLPGAGSDTAHSRHCLFTLCWREQHQVIGDKSASILPASGGGINRASIFRLCLWMERGAVG